MRLMIVDDDIQIREGIRYGINWESIGITEVNDYADGKKALEGYETFKPDIIVADIRMPHMDGLELLKSIRQIDENVRFILLSAYSDFEYCKEAICLGANDYELKPVKALKLMQIVEDNVKALLKEQRIQESYNKVYRASMLEKFLIEGASKEPISSKVIREFLEKQYQLYHIKMMFVVIIIPSASGEEIEKYNLSDRTEEYLLSLIGDEGILQKLPNQQIVYLAKLNHSMLSAFQEKNEIKGLLEKANSVLQQENLSICAGISDSFSLEDIKVGYKQAMLALSECFYKGEGSVVFYETSLKEKAQNFSGQKEFMDSLMQALNQMNLSEVDHILLQLKKNLKEERVDILVIKKFLEQIFRESVRKLEKYFPLADMQMQCDRAKYLDQYIEVFRGELEKIILYKVESERKKKYSKAISQAINYIEKHYMGPISIEQVASKVEKTPNYLSSIFKKEVGCSFTNYIIKLRMNEAKRMITKTGIPINEIAQKVGYEDYVYFSKVFKKTFGYSATFLRKNENLEMEL